MQLGFVGLGRMGGNMVHRLALGGHEVVAFNRSPGPVQEAVRNGAVGGTSLQDLVQKLTPPRNIWLMLPAGGVTDDYLNQLMDICQPGDLFVDGGNSKWKDTKARAARIKARGFEFVDCGTSGGIWGLQVGYSIMAGGSPDAFARVEPAIKTLAPENGYGLLGPNGAGHFVKLEHHEGWVDDSGEGRWTIEAAIDEDVPAPVITLSLFSRFYSRDPNSFSWRVLAALRNELAATRCAST